MAMYSIDAALLGFCDVFGQPIIAVGAIVQPPIAVVFFAPL